MPRWNVENELTQNIRLAAKRVAHAKRVLAMEQASLTRAEIAYLDYMLDHLEDAA